MSSGRSSICAFGVPPLARMARQKRKSKTVPKTWSQWATAARLHGVFRSSIHKWKNLDSGSKIKEEQYLLLKVLWDIEVAHWDHVFGTVFDLRFWRAIRARGGMCRLMRRKIDGTPKAQIEDRPEDMVPMGHRCQIARGVQIKHPPPCNLAAVAHWDHVFGTVFDLRFWRAIRARGGMCRFKWKNLDSGSKIKEEQYLLLKVLWDIESPTIRAAQDLSRGSSTCGCLI
jgi:hypothetical protein